MEGNKNFIWKAVKEALPTKLNLFKRKLAKDALCPICSRQEETATHALWSCEASSDVWAEMKNPMQKWWSCERSFFDIWEEMFSKLHKDVLEGVTTTLKNLILSKQVFFLKTNLLILESLFAML